jgi:hypothetical protein
MLDMPLLNWLIYSKNNKRRYSSLGMPASPTPAELYYRFGKSLSVRIRPVCTARPAFSFDSREAYCNEKLFGVGERECFLVEVRPANKLPD